MNKKGSSKATVMCMHLVPQVSERESVTWNRGEIEEHAWTCHNMMLAANSVLYNMASDDESVK